MFDVAYQRVSILSVEYATTQLLLESNYGHPGCSFVYVVGCGVQLTVLRLCEQQMEISAMPISNMMVEQHIATYEEQILLSVVAAGELKRVAVQGIVDLDL